MNRPVTQAMVAAHAGVSRALVSLVLRNSPQVSEERRAAVLRAMSELGYRPNAAARHLGRRTHTIGVVIQDLHYPFFAEVVDGISSAAEAAGLQVLINTGFRNPTVEQRALDTFLEARTDGVVLIAPQLANEKIEVVGVSAPTVVVGRPGTSDRFDSVHTHDEQGAILATEHLIGLGHRRILHVDAPLTDRNASSEGRRAGYTRAMRGAGLAGLARSVPDMPVDYAELDTIGSPDPSWFHDGEPPTAVFAHNDFIALTAARRFAVARPAVRLAVVGYDNTALASLSTPGLTTVDQPRRRMGSWRWR